MSYHTSSSDSPSTEEKRLLALFGTAESIVVPRILVAGNLSCEWDAGAIRYIKWRGVEVIRGVAYLYRDEDWGTAIMDIVECNIHEDANQFKVSFQAQLRSGDAAVQMDALMTGTANGLLKFEATSRTTRDVATARCGFVVLHPASVAGKVLHVTHCDGTVEETKFPDLISPSQPVLSIRQLRYEAASDLWVDCTLEAQLPHDPQGKFEMEDQRNWSDASFKTYVASLLDAWPYTLPAHQEFQQSVCIRIENSVQGDAIESPAQEPVHQLQIGLPSDHLMPQIGIATPPWTKNWQQITKEEITALELLRPQWILIEVVLSELELSTYQDRLLQFAQIAQRLGSLIQLDVVCPPDQDSYASAQQLKSVCDKLGIKPSALRALPEPLLKSYQPQGDWPRVPEHEAYVEALRSVYPECQIGSGAFTNFTELNRKRPFAKGLDFIGHSNCPIVHAADDRSVMETIEALPHIARTVQTHWANMPYRMGPISLSMHRNPYGHLPAHNPLKKRTAMSDNDPRHQGTFGAAWLAASAITMIRCNVEVLILNHTHGVSGPMLASRSTQPKDASYVPAFAVHCALAHAKGCPILTTHGLPNGIFALAWKLNAQENQLLLANATPFPYRVQLKGAEGCKLDKSNISDITSQRYKLFDIFEIKPYDTWLLRTASGN